MKYLLWFIFLVSFMPATGQPGVMRLELDAKPGEDIYQLVPCGDRGALVFYETTDFAGEGNKNWLFTLYDAELNETWKAHVPVLYGAEFQQYQFSDSTLWLFFGNTSRARQSTTNFQLLTIDLANGMSTDRRGSLPSESKLARMVIHGQKAYFALKLKNDQAAVYTYDLRSGEMTDFNVLLPDQNVIEDMVFDEAKDRLVALVSNYLSRRQNKMYLLALTGDGAYENDMEIATGLGSKYLNSARITALADSSYLVAGTYSNIASKLPGETDHFGIESTGVFVTRVKNQKQPFMNFYNLMEFRNLRAGLSARDFYRTSGRKVRESAEYSLNYEFLVHDIVVHDSAAVLMLEAFYPEFRTVSDMSYDYWGRPITHTYTVFEGYRFFNALVAAFSFSGELIWDNSIEVNLPLTRQLAMNASFYFDDKPILIFYNDGSRISYRVSMKNKELVPYSRLNIETSEAGDKVAGAGQNLFVHWYDHYFLAYGYHTIRNNLLAGRNERTVFYLNKISLE